MKQDYTMRHKNKVTKDTSKERSMRIKEMVECNIATGQIADTMVDDFGMDRNECYQKIRYWKYKFDNVNNEKA